MANQFVTVGDDFKLPTVVQATVNTITDGKIAAAIPVTPTADTLSGATVIGKSLIKATDAASARLAIGAGNSALVVGTTSTTAKAGDYQPTAANISDATVVGRNVLKAVDAAAARTATGCGIAPTTFTQAIATQTWTGATTISVSLTAVPLNRPVLLAVNAVMRIAAYQYIVIQLFNGATKIGSDMTMAANGGVALVGPGSATVTATFTVAPELRLTVVGAGSGQTDAGLVAGVAF